MNKLITAFSFLFLLSLSTTGLFAQEKTALEGTLVSYKCYEGEKEAESSHKTCSSSCITKETKMGLLTDDGTLVLLIMKKRSIDKQVRSLVGKKVKMSGEETMLRGFGCFNVEKVMTHPY